MTELNEVTYGGEVGSECHGGDQRWLVSPFSVSPSRVVQSRARETVRRVMICFTFVVLACSLSSLSTAQYEFWGTSLRGDKCCCCFLWCYEQLWSEHIWNTIPDKSFKPRQQLCSRPSNKKITFFFLHSHSLITSCRTLFFLLLITTFYFFWPLPHVGPDNMPPLTPSQ